MGSINFNIRMDEDLKKRAFPIIESYGLTPAQAVKLFFNQIATTQSIPISFEYNANSHTLSTNGERLLQESIADFKNGNYTELSDLSQLKQLVAEKSND